MNMLYNREFGFSYPILLGFFHKTWILKDTGWAERFICLHSYTGKQNNDIWTYFRWPSDWTCMPRASQKLFSWITSQISFTSSKLLFISNNQCNYSVFFLKITSKIQANKYSTIAYDIVLVLPVVIYCIILYSTVFDIVQYRVSFNASICMVCFVFFYFFPYSLQLIKIFLPLVARLLGFWRGEGEVTT